MPLADVLERVVLIFPDMTALRTIDSEVAYGQLDWSPLKRLPNLRELGLCGNSNVSAVMRQELRRLSGLTRLDLRQTGAGVVEHLKLLDFPDLKGLNLGDTGLRREDCAYHSKVHI